MSATEPRLALDRRSARPRGSVRRAPLGGLPGLVPQAPALVLLGLATVWPIVELVRASLGHYGELWHQSDLSGVALRTGIWVVGVVAVTVVLSLALAQLLHARLPLSGLARRSMIVPWAASMTVTSVIVRWALDPRTGTVDLVLHALGLVRLGSTDANWLSRPGWALAWMMAVAVFVSVPLTTYVLLAEMRTIPRALRDAGRLDGAVPWRRWRTVTFALVLRGLTAAALVTLVTVFNALPIVWEMTRGGPGTTTQISTSLMFSLRAGAGGESAALAVVNLVLVALAAVAFLRVTRPRIELWRVDGSGRLHRAGSVPAVSPARATDRRRPPRLTTVVACLAAAGVALLFLLPYVDMLVGALRPPSQRLAANLIPTRLTFANFTAVWHQGIGHNLLTSLVVAAAATALVLAAAIPAAAYCARRPGGGRPAIVALAVGVQLLAPVVLLDGITRAAGDVKLPALPTLIIVEAGFNLGFACWILTRSFRGLGPWLVESSRLDDLTPAGRLFRTQLRPAAGALTLAAVFTFVSAWNELAAALTLTGGGLGGRRPLTAALSGALGQAPVQWGQVLAACVIAALPAVALFALIEGRLSCLPAVVRSRGHAPHAGRGGSAPAADS